MAVPVVLLDACVLYVPPLRDLLLRLADLGLVRVHWTRTIAQEWTRAIASRRPDIPLEKLHRLRDLMDATFPDALITGYDHLLPTLELPDPDDRHVLAAAIVANAESILTFNTRDFSAAALDPHGIEAIDPDAWLCNLFDANPLRVLAVLAQQRQALRHPPKGPEAFLQILQTANLPALVARLQLFQSSL